MLYEISLVLLGLVSCVYSQRDYSVTATVLTDGPCDAIDDLEVYFTSDSGTSTSTFTLLEGGGEYSGSSSEADIGTIQYIDLAATGTDLFCIDYFEFSVNSTTTRACSGAYQGLWGLDSDCGDFGQASVPSMHLDVSESSAICWTYYNGDSTDTSKTPYYEENGWNEIIETAPSGTRMYSVSLLTGTDSSCGTTNTDVYIQLVTNCTFNDAGATALYCNPDTLIGTSYPSITPGAAGEWATLEFNDSDIGNVTYIYIEFGDTNTDAWCLDEMIVMTKYSTFGANDGLTIREYARCNISTFYYGGITFDGDCTGTYEGYKFITIRTDELAPYCNVYTETDSSSSPTLMPSIEPSSMPSKMPSIMPSVMPTDETGNPSLMPSTMPSSMPTQMPVAAEPSGMPTKVPTDAPVASGNMATTNKNINKNVYCLLLLFSSLCFFLF